MYIFILKKQSDKMIDIYLLILYTLIIIVSINDFAFY